MKSATKAILAGDRATLSDITSLRKRARQHIEEGAVTTAPLIAKP